MKFIVSSKLLSKNLSALNGVLGKSSLPILDNFLFTIKGEQLIITVSDLETTMKASIELSEVEGEGSVAISPTKLMSTIKYLPETPIVFSFDLENNTMKFSTEQGIYDDACYSGDEYPIIQAIESEDGFSIASQTLHRAINKTLFATGNDDMRASMMGVYCELYSDYISFVSTDAHKLVRYRSTQVKSENFASFILPKKTLTQLKNVLGTVSEEVVVKYSIDSHHVQFSFENLHVFSLLKEGKYPNYEQVIPENNTNKLLVNRNEFLNSVRRVGAYASQSTYQIRLSITENIIHITAEDFDYSSKGEETITAEFNGENMEIGFNSKFLIEMIENMDSEIILIEMSQPNRAALILPAEEYHEDESLMMLIMPVMLNN